MTRSGAQRKDNSDRVSKFIERLNEFQKLKNRVHRSVSRGEQVLFLTLLKDAVHEAKRLSRPNRKVIEFHVPLKKKTA